MSLGQRAARSFSFFLQAHSPRLTAKSQQPGGFSLLSIVFLFFCASVLPNPALALEACPFSGQIDFLHNGVNLVLGEKGKGSVALELMARPEHNYQLQLNFEHLKTSLFEISTQLESSIELVESADKKERLLQGQIISRYSLFNRKPIEEFMGSFQIKNHTLYLPTASVGGINMNGFIELISPYKMNLALQFNGMPLADFLSIWVDSPDLHAQGEVSGTIQVAGALNRLTLKGTLASYKGAVEELAYNSIVLNAEGLYPVVKLVNTIITQSDGMSFNLEGNIDLSDRQHFRKQIEALTKSPLVKEGDSQWEWTIKQKGKEDISTSELKYFLRKKDSQQNPLKESSDLMGVEQKIKF